MKRLEAGHEIKKINFRRYFQMLLPAGRKKTNKPKPDAEPATAKPKKVPFVPEAKELPADYQAMRDKNELPLYRREYLGNLLNYSADQYEEAFEKNLKKHAYPRMRNLLRKLVQAAKLEVSNRDIYHILKVLFDSNEDTEAVPTDPFEDHPSLSDEIYRLFGFRMMSNFFGDLKKEPIKFLSLFYKVQGINESNGWRNFNLIPMNRAGRRHVTYDLYSFYQILTRTKLCPKKQGVARAINISAPELDWPSLQFLKFDRKKKFTTFSTDGVAVSVRFEEEVKTSTAPASPSILPPADASVFDQFVGIDPGYREFIAAIKVPTDQVDISRAQTNVLISSRRYHTESGFHSRKVRLKKLTNLVDERIEEDRNTHDIPLWHKATSFNKEFIEFELKWMKEKQALYLKKAVTRLRFDKYIRTTATIAKYVKSLLGGNKMTAVFLGNAKFAANAPIKGYRRSPGSLLQNTLQNHPRCKVFMTDEYKTTKTSNCCHKEAFISASPHRYIRCETCKKTWNRDINAAINIFTVGLRSLKGQPKLLCFSRASSKVDSSISSKTLFCN